MSGFDLFDESNPSQIQPNHSCQSLWQHCKTKKYLQRFSKSHVFFNQSKVFFLFLFFFPCKKVEFWVERRQKWRKIKVRSEGSEIWFCSQSLFSLLGTWPNGGLLSYLGNLFPRKLKIGIIIPRKLGFHFSLLVFIFYFYCLDSWHSYEFLFLSVCNSKVNKVQKFNEHRMPYGKIFVTTFHETIFEIYF